MFWIILAFLLYFCPLVIVAYKTSWVKKNQDFSVALKSIPLALVFGSVCGTYIGPGFSMGFVGKGFHSGYLFWIMGILYGLQTILVGVMIAPKLQAQTNARTLGGVYREKTGRVAQAVVGILSVGLCAGFSTIMVKAGGAILQSYFGWPFWVSAVFVLAITMAYTLSGGLRGSITTDGLQFLFFTVILPSVMLWIFFTAFDLRAVTDLAADLTGTAFKDTSAVAMISLALSFLLGETLIPPYASRALASKTPQIAKKGFILSGVFAAVWFLVMLTIGIAARQVLPTDVAEDAVLLELVKRAPIFIQALLGMTLLGVVMSSLGPLMNSGAVSLSEDIVGTIAPSSSDKTRLLAARLATVGIAAIAAIGALKIHSLIDGLLIFYSVWAPAILPSLVYLLFAKRPSKFAVIASVCIGTMLALLGQFQILSGGLEPILWGMIGSIGIIAVTEARKLLWKS